MKVSNKIISGFLTVMLLAIVVLANQLYVIYRMQNVNRVLSDIDVNAATTAVDTKKLAEDITDDSKKYFAVLDTTYEEQLTEDRSYFLGYIAELNKTARIDSERAAITKLSEALDDYWAVFNRLKEQNRAWDSDELPPDLT